ncbi:MAG: hypothetical protein QM708_04610 [Propioniciclava sp.]|uniref:hypothetical protein n=1 Tax=Propioniciclava sp. TaxID=2038686 RepID=UPI0039E22283
MRRRPDRGVATLESVGIVALAAVLIGGVFLSGAQTQLGDRFREGVCAILGMECAGGTETDSHLPTEPCVISQSGWGGSLNVAVGVSVGRDVSVVTEQLSDGTYRVTVLSGGKLGAETGIGWDARVEWNGSSYGHDASASAQAHLEGSTSQVYTASSAQEAEAIQEWAIYQHSRDLVLGSGNPLGWVSDGIASMLGMQAPPTPAAVTYYGGLTADASAHLTTYAMFGADGELGAGSILGYTQYADGSTEVVTKIQGTAQVSGNVGPKSGQLGGTGEMYTVETFDPQGNRTGITLNYTGDGANDNTITSYHLPITNQSQQDAATRLMWDPFYFGDFQDLAMKEGQVNRVTYAEEGWDGALVVGGRFLAEVGVELTAEGISNRPTQAEYWDGNDWTRWAQCFPK